MKEKTLSALRAAIAGWNAPEVPDNIPHGDMPGDKVEIGEEHIRKSRVLFPALLPLLEKAASAHPLGKTVVAVCGGSGVGKSETASLIGWYLRSIGVGSYVMSGDNYPRRIPMYNDAERLQIFRFTGLRGLVDSGLYSEDARRTLQELMEQEQDAEPSLVSEHPWLAVYQREGRKGLGRYLGSAEEQGFEELDRILAEFKSGAPSVHLKRMGRTPSAMWFDAVDFSDTDVLILEWTHGNSGGFRGVDIPILLNSTPEETREHRRKRSRDGKTDSAFTTMVLEIEQKLLESQADRAALILSKSGELMSYAEYRRLMAGEVL